MELVTLEGSVTASGLGSLSTAYQDLLFALCKSGCSIPKIAVIPAGLARNVIQFTVRGAQDQVDIFRREWKR